MGNVLVSKAGAVGVLRISNHQKLNAMTAQMWRDLPGCIAKLDSDPEVRVIVLSGDGNMAFTAGADISEFGVERSGPMGHHRYASDVAAAYLAPIRATKPVIAKIHGVCMGGGLGLASSCDIRICSDDARFRMPAARVGLGYEQAGIRRFVELIGIQNTYDIFCTARTFDAPDALRMGFVSRVVPVNRLDLVTEELTEAIADNAPLTLKSLKLTINAFLQSDLSQSQQAQDAIDACNASADYAEGVLAFAEKRRARFTGR